MAWHARTRLGNLHSGFDIQGGTGHKYRQTKVEREWISYHRNAAWMRAFNRRPPAFQNQPKVFRFQENVRLNSQVVAGGRRGTRVSTVSGMFGPTVTVNPNVIRHARQLAKQKQKKQQQRQGKKKTTGKKRGWLARLVRQHRR